MEQKQITLEDVYQKISKIEVFMVKMDQYMEDLEFARRTEEAYRRIESGEGVTMEFDDFIKEMKKW